MMIWPGNLGGCDDAPTWLYCMVLGITSEVIPEQREEDSSKNHRCAIMIGSATEVSGIGDWNALLVFAVALQQISWQRNQDVPQEEEENELRQLSLSFTTLQWFRETEAYCIAFNESWLKNPSHFECPLKTLWTVEPLSPWSWWSLSSSSWLSLWEAAALLRRFFVFFFAKTSRDPLKNEWRLFA